MKRKVVKHGSSTLTVSLPSNWAKEYGLKSGDELEVIEEKGRLVVSPQKDLKTIQSSRINIDDWGVLDFRAVSSLFKSGCDVIRIDFKDPSNVTKVEYLVNEMIGFEILQQDENYCILKEVSSPIHAEALDDIIKRIFLLLISISEDYLRTATADKNSALIRNLIKRDQSINKFCNFCRRVMNKKGIIQIKDLPTTYYIVEELENLGDEYKYLGKFLIDNNTSIEKKEVRQILERIHSQLKEFFRLYFKFSKEDSKRFEEENKDLMRSIDSQFRKTKDVASIRLLNHCNRIQGILAKMLGPLLTMKVAEMCSDLNTFTTQ